MRYIDHRSELGQTAAEYAVLLALVAVGCLAALVILSGSIDGLFSNNSNVFNPPNAPPVSTRPSHVVVPRSVQDCMNEGWRNYPQFEDQASCVQFVTGGG